LAQQFVNYVAEEETVKLSRGESVATDREVIAKRNVKRRRLSSALIGHNSAGPQNAVREPSGALQAQIESDVDLASKVHQSLIDARSDIAEYQEKPDFARELPGLRARRPSLKREAWSWKKGIEQKSAVASQRSAERQKLEVELKMAQTASESMAARLRICAQPPETRGERLRVIDPGIVPQRPSSPNVPLNVFAALL